MNANQCLLLVLEAARIVVDLGEEWRLNEVDSEVACLERRRSIVGDHRHVLIETPEKVIECCKFSITDHRLHLRVLTTTGE